MTKYHLWQTILYSHDVIAKILLAVYTQDTQNESLDMILRLFKCIVFVTGGDVRWRQQIGVLATSHRRNAAFVPTCTEVSDFTTWRHVMTSFTCEEDVICCWGWRGTWRKTRRWWDWSWRKDSKSESPSCLSILTPTSGPTHKNSTPTGASGENPLCMLQLILFICDVTGSLRKRRQVVISTRTCRSGWDRATASECVSHFFKLNWRSSKSSRIFDSYLAKRRRFAYLNSRLLLILLLINKRS